MNEKIVFVYRWLVILPILFINTSCQKETGFRPLPESVMLFIATPPSLQIDSAVSLTLPVKLYGTVLSAGSDSIQRYGFCYSSVKQLPTVSDSTVETTIRVPSMPSKFVLTTSLLQRTELYYARAFAQNKQGVAYSESVVTFRVPDNRSIPVVVTSSIENVSATSANIKASVESDGHSPVTAYGICYSITHPDPDLSDQVSITATSLSGAVPFPYSALLQGLTNGSTYYVRAFATNEMGTSYGEHQSFRTTTSTTVAPTVQTDNVLTITSSSATIDGALTSKGTAEITSYGFCYSLTNPNPTTADLVKASGTTVTAPLPFSFSSSITTLSATTSYFIRAFATSSAGTSYGVTRSFQTLGITAAFPVVQTTEIPSTSITTTTAMAKGMLQSAGSAVITRYGFCYSSSQANPTIADQVIVSGTTNPSSVPFAFSGNLNSLSAGTSYALRAFATSSAGTAYGDIISFKTVAQMVASPSVQTINFSGVSYSSASVFNNLTAAGSSPITSYGVVYSSTNTTPTVADSKVINGTSSPSPFPFVYTSSLTSLVPNTTYNVRAYATNSVGTTYGEAKRFATLAAIPSVITDQVMFSQPDGSITAKGTIQGNGAAPITRFGFCYSASNPNPSITDNSSDAGTSASAFPFSFNKMIFRLSVGNYYFRAFASNTYGIAYGNVMSTTVYAAPSVTTESATEKNAEAGLETLLGSITSSGSSPIIEYGFCYTKSSNAGRIGFGVGDANIAVVKQTSPAPSTYPFRYLNDVTVAYNTDYSYRAYVKTINGYFYGDIRTFYISYKP